MMRTLDTAEQLGLGFYCIGCPYSEYRRCSGPRDLGAYGRNGKSFIGCANPHKGTYYADIHRRYIEPHNSNQAQLKLTSRYIPQVFSRRRDIVLDVDHRLVYISLDQLIKSDGTIKFVDKAALFRALGLGPTTRIALVGTCRDLTLERFWTKSEISNSFQAIANFGFEFVTGLSLSVYDEWPLFSQRYNQDRNYLSHDILSSLGVPSIPFLMPATSEDYDHLESWLNRRTDIKLVAVHATNFTRSDALFQVLVDRMTRIECSTNRHLQFLVVGVAKPPQMKFLLHNFDTIILNSRPVMEAIRAGNRYDKQLSAFPAREAFRDDLVLPNILAFENFCNAANNTMESNLGLRS